MLKYVNTGIVFQEIPDEVTLAINISNCPCHCPGCHSHYLWEDIGLPLNPEAIDDFVQKFGSNLTCIAFMGGDGDPKGVNLLPARYANQATSGLTLTIGESNKDLKLELTSDE